MENNLEEIKKVKMQFKKKIDIKDLGLLKYFLEIKMLILPMDYLLHKKICI
jgi:hypothetical protein